MTEAVHGTGDIEPPIAATPGGHQYVYDGSGNLVTDYEEGLDIRWNAYGKVKQVRRLLPPVPARTFMGARQETFFRYNAAGNRVAKYTLEYTHIPSTGAWTTSGEGTYYVRDANEEVLAVYTRDLHSPDTTNDCFPYDGVPSDADTDALDGTQTMLPGPYPCDNCPAVSNPWQEDYDGDGTGDACDPCPLVVGTGGCSGSPLTNPVSRTTMFEMWEAANPIVKLEELHFYGSASHGRVGMYMAGTTRDTVPPSPTPTDFTRTLANRRYELKDHLGDVRVVVTDLKLDGTNGPGISPWIADVRAYNNPYSFGMLQAERSWASDGYRYGFNGKEQDNDLKNATGGSLDFGARMYDARVGRWWGVDPDADKHHDESPYAFVSSNPIVYIDPDGAEKVIVIGGGDVAGKDRNKFASVGLKQLNDYLSKLKKANSKELATLLVVNVNMTSAMREQIESYVRTADAEYAGNVSVQYVAYGRQVTNYFNSKSLGTLGLTEAREKDKISDAAFVGHGYQPRYASQALNWVGSFEPGHGTSHEDMENPASFRPIHMATAWGGAEVCLLEPSAWLSSARCDMHTCNAATPGFTEVNLAQVMSLRLGITVSGWLGRSDFSNIYLGEGASKGGVRPSQRYPAAGTQVNGKPSEQYVYKNGQRVQ